jgi:hypothetical protein
MRSFILPCYLKIIRKEFDMQNSLIQYESENLKQIYRDYHRLNALLQGSQFLANPGASPDPRVKDILARYAPKGFPNSGFVGFDRFDLSRGMFIGHRMDSIGRLESYLRQGLRTETANLPPINTGIEFTYPFNNLMDLEYFSNPRPVQMQVTSHSSPEAFAQAFIRVMNGSGGRGIPEYVNYFEWSSSWANRFDEFLTILVSLRKTGEVEIYRAGQRACLGQTQDEDCQIERTSLSNDELENGLFSILDLVGGNAGDIAAAQALQVTSRGRAMNNYRSETGAITFFDWGAGFLFHPNTRETIGLFDYAYILAANSRLGGFQVIPWRDSLGVSRVREEAGLSAVDRASQLYRARIAEQILLFRMPEDISESLRLATKSRVDSEFEKPAAIVNLADRIAERDRAQGLRRVYRVHTRRGNTHENFYIDRRIVADQESVVETFHRETNSIFRR